MGDTGLGEFWLKALSLIGFIKTINKIETQSKNLHSVKAISKHKKVMVPETKLTIKSFSGDHVRQIIKLTDYA